MDFRIEDRSWDRDRHLSHLQDGEWQPMFDADHKVLVGIVGKVGVSGTKHDGTQIGADFVKMDPGAAFPLHEHVGDHEIFFISGAGFVRINDEDVEVIGGQVIHIPGEYPHGVWVAKEATEPLIFVAMGHPHKHVHAADRMQHPHRHG